ncbi:hypothetical protein PHMEG_00032614 [Phytophthora megakarya]|uniref:6-pyruvoyltetrahydropterin synthase n=1 Tax=Phytophthora megakarya TaxID=4795 RepID=A0A225UV90_9STRA|nr:hypothetical protein PHMEG_00032614 [Phytophthora megakarya]
MGKDFMLDQKAVKMDITRGVADGVINYCEKNMSTNVDSFTLPHRLENTKMLHQPLHKAATIAAPYPPKPTAPQLVKVHVSKDYMKFNAAHFIAYKGFREKLHGHNYRLAVTITGQVGPDGYVVDFGEIKRISRVICKDLNESFLVPMNSDVLKISCDDTNISITTEDLATFSFPKADCSLLPIVHSSAEELAIFITNQLVNAFTLEALLERGVQKLEVNISEADQQFASYERMILSQTTG